MTNRKYDCTSFGPKSIWDKLLFVVLAGSKYDGKIRKDGDYEIYEISNDYNNFLKTKINNSETFEDQAKQGRRPRLSIFKTFVIDEKNKFKLKPAYTGNIFTLF